MKPGSQQNHWPTPLRAKPRCSNTCRRTSVVVWLHPSSKRLTTCRPVIFVWQEVMTRPNEVALPRACFPRASLPSLLHDQDFSRPGRSFVARKLLQHRSRRLLYHPYVEENSVERSVLERRREHWGLQSRQEN